ncbi:hypothetical protein ABU162_25180 [Paenibacillus thiaminolyticus]|uniref:hypothetical protein n=1 Tax=Paenibacillus thiaminolyticus TaxID=49283 RepID=UPI0035A67DC6
MKKRELCLIFQKEKSFWPVKRAFAALYYSFKYSYGYAVAGAPQSYLGLFLLEQHKDSDIVEVAKFIAGDDEIVARKYLDELIFKTVEDSDSHPKVFIHVGKGDHHYWKHVIPFINHLEKLEISYQLDLADYNSHSELVEYYPPYLLKTIRSIIGA